MTNTENTMLADLHVHTKKISKCCQISARANIKLAKKKGFDALAITNHYTYPYFRNDKTKSFDKKKYDRWIEAYIKEWNKCRKLGKRYGVHIFCGVEVTLRSDPKLHMLIYGADEAFLRGNPLLCNMSLPELYQLCRDNGCALVQAHPFRSGATVQDTAFLDGVEVNCHPLYEDSFYSDVIKIAKQHGLAVVAGCDYHADTYRAEGGTFLPVHVKSDRELAKYILTADKFTLQIHDPMEQRLFICENPTR